MMAPASSVAERHQDVRRAARRWESAGFLGKEARLAIDARYPDDRTRLPTGFRILAFIMTGVAILGSFGFLLLVGDGGGERAAARLAAGFALLCAVATEVQRGHWRRADAGAELATALLTLIFAAVAVVLWSGLANATPAIPLGVLAVLGCALAARWGSGLLGLLAALLFFAWLAQFSAGRLLWILFGACGIGPLLAVARHPALAPTHRLGCWLAAGVAVLALYLSVNLLSWDQGWVEALRLGRVGTGPPPGSVLRIGMAAATGAVPLLLLASGWHRRESLLVILGCASLAASAATLQHYQPVLPPAYALLLAGAVMLAAALGGRRWVRVGPGGERHGWTTEPLFDIGTQTAAVTEAIRIVAFTPAAQVPAPPGHAGEGQFGGGGATGNY